MFLRNVSSNYMALQPEVTAVSAVPGSCPPSLYIHTTSYYAPPTLLP
jgi:hypothetical protein